MTTKFHSKVVRVNEMGGKVVVEFKEKLVETDKPDPVVETSEVEMYDTWEPAETAISTFMGTD
jgi:hypothetical protein